MPVYLDHLALNLCDLVARARIAQNIKEGRVSRYGSRSYLADLYGAKGELSVAIFLGIPWGRPVGDHRYADVNDMVDVRACEKDHHCLLLHPDDKKGVPYVSVQGSKGRASATFTVRGWKLPEEVWGRKDLWRDPLGGMPAYFVPPGMLNDPSALIQRLGIERPLSMRAIVNQATAAVWEEVQKRGLRIEETTHAR